MAGVVDAVSAFINPANVVSAGLNTGIGLGLQAGVAALSGGAIPAISATGALTTMGISHAVNSVMKGFTPRPNTGNGLANALNTYSQAQPATAQPQNNLGQILQNIGDTIISRIETTNALVQKLIDVQTGKEELDYRRKATQYGRMAQSLSRTAMGRIFLNVMSKTMGRAGAELNHMTQGALEMGVTTRKELFTTKLLSQIPMMSKYFGKSMDILAKNILRVQSPFTKETDVTINQVLPKRLEVIGKLMDKRLTESNKHLTVISEMSTEIRGEFNHFQDFMKESVEHYKRTANHQETLESVLEQTTTFISGDVGKFLENTKHHYTEVERILHRSYIVLSTTLPQILQSVSGKNTMEYVDRDGNIQTKSIIDALKYYASYRYPLENNKGETRRPNDYGKDNYKASTVTYQKITATLTSLDTFTQSLSDTGPNNLLAQAMQMSLDKKNRSSGLSLMDCLTKVIQQQQEAATANQEGQEKLQKAIASKNEDKGWLSNLGETASSLLTTAIDTKNAFLHFGMNLPNLLTKTLSSIVRVGIGMFLGRQLIGLLYKVFTGSTSNIVKEGFIGTLWHDGIFSAIMYAKDKIAGYLGDAVNWVFKAITGSDKTFKETIDSGWNSVTDSIKGFFIDNTSKILGMIFTAVTAFQFGRDALLPVAKSMMSGIMGFVPQVIQGLLGGFQVWGSALFGAVNAMPIIGSVARAYKRIIDFFNDAAIAGAMNPTWSERITASMKLQASGLLNGLSMGVAKSFEAKNKELLAKLDAYKAAGRITDTQYEAYVQRIKTNAESKWQFKAISWMRKVFERTERDVFGNVVKDANGNEVSAKFSGLARAGAFAARLFTPFTNIVGGIFTKIGSGVMGLIGPMFKNPLMLPMLWKTLTKAVNAILGSMFNESQRALMTTGDKAYAVGKFIVDKIIDTIKVVFEYLNPIELGKMFMGALSGVWEGLKSGWNSLFGDESRPRIIATVSEETQEDLQKSREASVKLVDLELQKLNQMQEQTSFLNLITKGIDTVKEKVVSGFEVFMDVFKPRNLGFARGKIKDTFLSLFGLFGGSKYEEQVRAGWKKNDDELLKKMRAAMHGENDTINETFLNQYDSSLREEVKKMLKFEDHGNVKYNAFWIVDKNGNYYLNPNLDKKQHDILELGLKKSITGFNEMDYGEMRSRNGWQGADALRKAKEELDKQNASNISNIATTTQGILEQTKAIYGEVSGSDQFRRQLAQDVVLSETPYNKLGFNFLGKDLNEGENIASYKNFDQSIYGGFIHAWNSGKNINDSGRSAILTANRDEAAAFKRMHLDQLSLEDRKRLLFGISEKAFADINKNAHHLTIENALKYAHDYDSSISGYNNSLNEAIMNMMRPEDKSWWNVFGIRESATEDVNKFLTKFQEKYVVSGDRTGNNLFLDRILKEPKTSKLYQQFIKELQSDESLSDLRKAINQYRIDKNPMPILETSIGRAINWNKATSTDEVISQIRGLNDSQLKLNSEITGQPLGTIIPHKIIASEISQIVNSTWLKQYGDNIEENKKNPNAIKNLQLIFDSLYSDIGDAMNLFILGSKFGNDGQNIDTYDLALGIKDGDSNLILTLYNTVFSELFRNNTDNTYKFKNFIRSILSNDEDRYAENLNIFKKDSYNIGETLIGKLDRSMLYGTSSDKDMQRKIGIGLAHTFIKNGLLKFNGKNVYEEDGQFYDIDHNKVNSPDVIRKFFNFKDIGEPSYQSDSRSSYNDWDKAIAFSLQYEGGRNFNIVNGVPVLKGAAKNDLGGATAYGITIPTLKSAYKSGVVPHADITKLTQGEAKQIYRKNFWDRYRWGELAWPVNLMALDCSINHGGFAWILQRAAAECGQKVTIDGKFGPETFNALKACDPRLLSSAIVNQRRKYYEAIVAKNPKQSVFMNGWLNRNNAMAKAANSSAGGIATTTAATNKIPSVTTSFNFNDAELARAKQYLDFRGNSGTLTSFMLMRPEMRSRVLDMAEGYYNSSKKLGGYSKLRVNSAWRSTPYQDMLSRSGNKYSTANASNIATHYLGIAVDMDKVLVNWLRSNGFLNRYNLTQPFPSKDPVHIQFPGFISKDARKKISDANNYPLSMQRNGLYMEPNLKMTPEEFVKQSLALDPFIKNISSAVGSGETRLLDSWSGSFNNSNNTNTTMSDWNIDINKSPFLAMLGGLSFEDRIISKMKSAGINTDVTNSAINAMQLLGAAGKSYNSTPIASTSSAGTDTNVGEPVYKIPSFNSTSIAEPVPIKLPNFAETQSAVRMLEMQYMINGNASAMDKSMNNAAKKQIDQMTKLASDSNSMNATSNEILKVIGNLAMAMLKNGGTTNNILTNIANDTSTVSNNNNSAPKQLVANPGDRGKAALSLCC